MSGINARAAQGIKVLLVRQGVLQLLTLGAGVVLARTLAPAEFGLYFIASFVVSSFAFFGDFGLAASLIQRGEELTIRELRVALTVQQLVTSVVVAAIMVAAPWVARLYPKAPPETVWLIRALAFGLYLDSWRSLSVLQLERSLRYRRVAVVEVGEGLIYQATAVALALDGLGVWSFVAATLVRGVFGTVAAFTLAPWKVGFAFDRTVARGLLRFGAPFQLASLAQQAGSWLTPLLVGTLIGPNAVGLLTWASSNGRKPLMVVANVMRVAFPHFSRLQDDRAEVDRVFGRYLRLLFLGSAAWLVAVAASAPWFVPAVYGSKWEPAVPALLLFSTALLFDTVAWVTETALAGLGAVGAVARANVLRTVVNVALGSALVVFVGQIGVPIVALAATAAIVPTLLRRLGGSQARRLAPALAPLGAGLSVAYAAHTLPLSGMPDAIAAGGLSLTAFAAVALRLRLIAMPWPVRRLRAQVESEVTA